MHADVPKQRESICHYAPLSKQRTSNRKWKKSSGRYEKLSKIEIALLDGKPQLKKGEREVFTIISPGELKYRAAKKRILELCSNLEDLESPNQAVQNIALYTLNLLKEQNVFPSLINATGDESLLFEFFIEEHSFSIDFYNNGEIIYLRRINNLTPFISEVDSEQLKEIVLEIAHTYAKTDM